MEENELEMAFYHRFGSFIDKRSPALSETKSYWKSIYETQRYMETDVDLVCAGSHENHAMNEDYDDTSLLSTLTKTIRQAFCE